MLLYADRKRGLLRPLHGQVLNDIAALPNASIYLWYEQGTGSRLPVQGCFSGDMDISQVNLPDAAVYHLCGPIPFMHEVHSALTKRGVEPRDIQYEVFGPDLWHADYD